MTALDPMEEHVIRGDISQERRRAFIDGYLGDRERAATLETLCRHASALQETEEWRESDAYGFSILLQKGPFVEGSNWVPYNTWELATAAERHLLSKYARLLDATVQVEHPSARARWDELIPLARQFISDLRPKTVRPESLVIVMAGTPSDLTLDLHTYTTPKWNLPKALDLPWVVGELDGAPIVQIRSEERASMYVADIHRFAQLHLYRGNDERGRVRVFELTTISRSRASEMLDANPSMVTALSTEGHDPIRRLRLSVSLRLYEAAWLSEANADAVRGVRIDL